MKTEPPLWPTGTKTTTLKKRRFPPSRLSAPGHSRLHTRKTPWLAPPFPGNRSISNGTCGTLKLNHKTTHDADSSCLVMAVDLPVPVTTAYRAWNVFQDMPYFMRDSTACQQFDGARITWLIRTWVDQFAWHADVFDRVPLKHIAWKSALGAPYPNLGWVYFDALGDRRSRVRIRISFQRGGRNGQDDPSSCVRAILERRLRAFHRKLTSS